jgi:hypothetical protein
MSRSLFPQFSLLALARWPLAEELKTDADGIVALAALRLMLESAGEGRKAAPPREGPRPSRKEPTMTDAMATFRTDVALENPQVPGARQVVKGALVDTGAALS